VFVEVSSGVAPGVLRGGDLRIELEAAGVPVHEVATGVLSRVGDVRTSQGWAAVGVLPDLRPPVAVGERALVLLLVGVADPGNVGTLLRSADASSADAVVLSAGCADPFSPKVVRAAAGSLLRTGPVESDDPVGLVAGWGLSLVACVAHGGVPLDEVDLRGAVALALGSEAHGLPPAIEAAAATRASIPLPGDAESLNVAMAGTVALYEAVRQRRRRTRAGSR
jgi:TrmH family RNA methyltransferase